MNFVPQMSSLLLSLLSSTTSNDNRRYSKQQQQQQQKHDHRPSHLFQKHQYRLLSSLLLHWASLIEMCIILLLLLESFVVVQGAQQEHNVIRTFQKKYPQFIPDVVLDIGANQGLYAQAIRSIYPTSKLILFEASAQHTTKLQNFVTNDPNNQSEVYITVLSSHDNETVPFYDSNTSSTGNSIFQEQTSYFRNVKPIMKPTSTVDTILQKQSKLMEGSSNIDIIKIDVQGAELLVLQGAIMALQQATVIQFEGSTIEYNAGGSCWYQVDHFLRLLGYYFYDIGDLFYHPGLFKTKGVGQMDVLYIKPTSLKFQSLLLNNNNKQQQQQQAPIFCGSGRNPYDLYGISKSLQSDLLNEITSKLSLSSSTISAGSSSQQRRKQEEIEGGGLWNNDIDGNTIQQEQPFGWYFGFLVGIILTILVQQFLVPELHIQYKKRITLSKTKQ